MGVFSCAVSGVPSLCSHLPSRSDENLSFSHAHRRHTSADLGLRKAFTPETKRSIALSSGSGSPPFPLDLSPSSTSGLLASPIGGTEAEYKEEKGERGKGEDRRDEGMMKEERDKEENEEGKEEEEKEELAQTPRARESREEEEERSSHEQGDDSSSTLCPPKHTDSPDEGEPRMRFRHMSLSFRQALLSLTELKSDTRIGLEVAKLADPQLDVVQVFGRCLPHVVPNVILAKREVSGH